MPGRRTSPLMRVVELRNSGVMVEAALDDVFFAVGEDRLGQTQFKVVAGEHPPPQAAHGLRAGGGIA
jgi:hypothetical protein